MGQLKKLAGDTAIYGVSSILGRLINYLLVWLHTSVFFPGELGIVAPLYAYTAIFMVIYTFGMETAFFRFSKTIGEKTYYLTSTTVLCISTPLSVLIFLFSEELSYLIGYPGTGLYIQWLAIITWIDAFLSIPFAKLRQENRPVKFAVAKMSSIAVNVLLQTSFLAIVPYVCEKFSIENPLPDIGIGYIFLANLISNALIIPILFKEISQIRILFDSKLFKPIIAYAFPIFIMGVAGMLNEQIDKILIEHWLPDSFYDNMNSTEANGVYSQTFKLAIFMMLAIQAFRYAGEPFFFSKAEDKNAPELFARVMHYFVIAGLFIFVLVSINVDLIASIFLRKPEFRVALYLVPLLLFGKLLYGIYINLSIWFKLSDKTIFGTYFSILGVALIVVGNLVLIPILGLLGCAISIIICYAVMCLFCYFYGQKYYPIPYEFHRVIPYSLGAFIIVGIFHYWHNDNIILDSSVRIVSSLLIAFGLFWFEKRNLKTKRS